MILENYALHKDLFKIKIRQRQGFEKKWFMGLYILRVFPKERNLAKRKIDNNEESYRLNKNISTFNVTILWKDC